MTNGNDDSSLLLRNNLIAGNSGFAYGGAVALVRYVTMVNNTVVNNSGNYGGAYLRSYFVMNGSSSGMHNNIFWANNCWSLCLLFCCVRVQQRL